MSLNQDTFLSYYILHSRPWCQQVMCAWGRANSERARNVEVDVARHENPVIKSTGQVVHKLSYHSRKSKPDHSPPPRTPKRLFRTKDQAVFPFSRLFFAGF